MITDSVVVVALISLVASNATLVAVIYRTLKAKEAEQSMYAEAFRNNFMTMTQAQIAREVSIRHAGG